MAYPFPNPAPTYGKNVWPPIEYCLLIDGMSRNTVVADDVPGPGTGWLALPIAPKDFPTVSGPSGTTWPPITMVWLKSEAATADHSSKAEQQVEVTTASDFIMFDNRLVPFASLYKMSLRSNKTQEPGQPVFLQVFVRLRADRGVVCLFLSPVLVSSRHHEWDE